MTAKRRLASCYRAIAVLVCVLCSSCDGGEAAEPSETFPYWDGPDGTLCAKLSDSSYCFPKSSVMGTNLPGETAGIIIYAPDDLITDDDCNKARLKKIGDYGSNVPVLIMSLERGDTMEALAGRLSRFQESEYGITRDLQDRMKGCVTFPAVRGRDTVCTGALEDREEGSKKTSFYAECTIPTEYVVNPDCALRMVSDNLKISFSVSRYCSGSMRQIGLNTVDFIRSHETTASEPWASR